MSDSNTIPDGYKKCSSGKFCINPEGPILPATTKYFHRHKPSDDGLKPRCKACRISQEKMRRNGIAKSIVPEAPKGMKRCSKCQSLLPLSTLYFYRKSSAKDGLDSWCKACVKGKPRPLRRKRKTSEEIRARKKAYNKAYRARNYERLRQREREYYRTHREERKAYNKKYYASQRGRMSMRAADHRRKSRKRNAEGEFSKEDVAVLYKSQKGRCWWCGKKVGQDYHIDHRIPLSKGGTNYPENLCISCPHCNQSKRDHMPWEWNGRLL